MSATAEPPAAGERAAEPPTDKAEAGGKAEAGDKTGGDDKADKGAKAEAEPKDEAPKAPIVGEKVIVGAYLNDIQSLDLKTHSYAADVYLWFRWKHKDFDPAEAMEFANPSELWGHVRNNDNEEPEELENGERYQVVRAQGRFSCKLPLDDYPLDKQVLFIEFEDKNLDATQMTYVADSPSIEVNPNLVLPGFAIDKAKFSISTRKYASNFGDPRGGKHLEFSRARIELPIHRPQAPHLIKMLLPVLCVVLCAAMMFLFRATYVDSRVELGITSLLTVVALQMTLNQDLPDIAYLVLVDKVYIATYLYVMAGIAVVVKTTHLHDDGKTEAAVRVNRLAMLLTTLVYAAGLASLILPKVG
ncbi:MAG: hypothetical protein FJ100_23845 [Deltaproteobacteria bacterium]|nr:hypothetical protein [Deltaproteobacteria bacterium]